MTANGHERSREGEITDTKGLAAWESDFLRAARRYSRPRRKIAHVTASLVAVAIALPAGYAVADHLAASDSATTEPRLVMDGDVITLGFIDPGTGKPLRCPDGGLFTGTVDATKAPAVSPTCSDGSVPAVYAEYEKKAQEFRRNPPREAYIDPALGPDSPFSLDGMPRLPTFEISQGSGG